DYDNDGDLDLFVAENFGPNLYVGSNNGKGEFTSVAVVKNGYFSGFGFSFGDYDRDGWMDIVVISGPELILYRNQGKGADGKVLFAPVTPNPFKAAQQNPTSTAWGDYDNDGLLDLYVTYNNQQKNILYHNAGNGSFTPVTGDPIVTAKANSEAATWADYDNDGDLDLFAGNRYHTWEDSRNYLFRNNGTDNNWLEVKLTGVVSNASAIGARVKIYAADQVLMREVSPSSGLSAGNPLLVHFGLGTAARVAYLKVEWPSGKVQWLTDVAVNQLITVKEAEKPLPLPAAPAGFTARAVSPYEISLAWDDYPGTASGLFLEKSLTGQADSYRTVARLEPGTTRYRDGNLGADSTYYYRLRAHLAGDIYSAYVTASATTEKEPVPAAPGALAAEATSPTAIELTWTDQADNEDSYYVERSPTGQDGSYSVIAQLPPNTSRHLDTSLAPATTYHYRVRAKRGKAAYSAYATARATTQATPQGKKNDAKLYPIPASSEVTVLFEHEALGKVTLELFDLHGQRWAIYQLDKTTYGVQQKLPLAGLPKGKYLLKITIGDDVQTKTIVKLTE
ncbi:MAG: VCBS repeat-containing protein, partial [Cytophagales bacterium]|nr:VCBS repeat-containing protein [Cytophagales bacterium]